ncbi:TTL domain-containing protein [Verticillium alfalfae VaMs.102]|uniref:TTL domain-containing protein n=1 Tax=Verticillium alfalfae (strain VaMs.102 / ATCC MYA-4576 / FGSC 10136) TaxID=526221 RepID=C9STB9_VERA1|nr:TTL domain-containing protein [Verticillium alfalfae VaMs.102]EEY22034.1 TTL domain-containing protein [Verticillium alfalfae VaMs.102]
MAWKSSGAWNKPIINLPKPAKDDSSFPGLKVTSPEAAGTPKIEYEELQENELMTSARQRSATTATTTTPTVRRLAALGLAPAVERRVRDKIGALTGDVFEGAARGMTVHFQPLPGAFEVYGLDFLVDAAGDAWLLEVNAFPDFKQSGDGRTGQVVAGFWRGVVRTAVAGFFGVETPAAGEGEGTMELVREIDLGRR